MVKNPIFLGDGNKEPRPVQTDYFRHLVRKWNKHDIFGAHLPPGCGKTYIARTIQQVFGKDAMVLTISNHLLDQFLEDYPSVNHLKGKTHYKHNHEYLAAYERAGKKASIANPLSYFYAVKCGRIPTPKVLIIDEAHKLYDTMFLAAYNDFPVKALDIPEFKDNYDLIKWVHGAVRMFESKLAQVERLSEDNRNRFFNLFDKLTILQALAESGDHTFTFEYTYVRHKTGRTEKVLRVIPVELNQDFFEPFLKAKKIVFMSGTLTKYDLKFYGKNADYYTCDYLTRPENREVKYRPIPERSRKCPETIAKEVMAIYEAEGKQNTVVHVTYDMSYKLQKFLPDWVITHSKETKDKAIDQFKADGGLFLACGCAEGVDLPDDYCRVIIIPNLLYPNLGDEMVRKRKAMREGVFRYTLGTMMTTVQQLGRGARHADDKCISYILDPQFSLLYSQTYEHLPNDLNIDWKSA